MIKVYKPLWEEGILLSPQHFQQQESCNRLALAAQATLLGNFVWGVIEQAVSEELLELGKLKFNYLRLILSDNTCIDTKQMDIAIPARNLDDIPPHMQRVAVSVALPVWQVHKSNLLEEGESTLVPKRFQREYVKIANQFGDDEVEIAVERPNLQLKFDFEATDDYLLCPVAVLQRNDKGGFELDPNYIAPSLFLSSHPLLVSITSRIGELLLSRSHALSKRKRARDQSTADFSVSDSSLFWFLHSINSIWPEINHLNQFPEQHPEVLYKLLIRLVGMLTTFCMDETLGEMVGYQHLDLFSTFSQLETRIRTLLDTVIPSPVVLIDLAHVKVTQWKAQLYDPRINAEADFYLSAHSSLPLSALQEQLPQTCKVGAPDEIERIINTAVLGIPLRAMTQIPPGLPFRMDNVYFLLDKQHPAFERMLKSQVCSIYAPASISGLSLNLYAVVNV